MPIEQIVDDLLDDETCDTGAAGAEPKAKAPIVPLKLCKGSMPAPLVWFIKYHEQQDARAAVAKKYFTTPGKITDIQTSSNQKYIVPDMVFSKDELDLAAQKVKENFVRGQAEEAATPGSVTKRLLATTNLEDAAYSLSVIEKIRELQVDATATTLAAARAAYNEQNPRKTRVKADSSAPEAGDSHSGEESTSVDDDLLS